ncbi:hypothetical protein [Polymorphospora rubra]|uniref:Uncharacterized protein n=1 Tax=Polymorphospora rubra TaxID=338584 RepID=A0A810MWT9_9ACTN|nr:hypothetical protein [Polymorphospora rubra]BCJ65671.1 hypothetical protein Prubr_26920 [Polymorphospora rubra]
MISVFRFPLADVLNLAEHAVAATEHADPVSDEPPGPRCCSSCYGVYLMSNGLPQPPPPRPAGASTVRAVFADRLDRDQPDPDGDDLLVALPLRRPHTPHRATTRRRQYRRNSVIVTILGRQVTVSPPTCPRRARPELRRRPGAGRRFRRRPREGLACALQ